MQPRPASPRTPASRLPQAWDLACLALAAVLRGAVLFGTRADSVFRVPYLDGAFYHVWGRSLAEGRGDFQGPYFLGPLYPYFLAALYRLAGPEPLAARIVQSALGVADAALVLSLGRRLFGTAPARAAVLVFALYGPLVFYENLLVMDPLLTTLTLASLWFALIGRGGVAARGGAAGLLLGLASLGRPTALVASPVLGWALRQRRGMLAGGAALLLVTSPVLVRNARLGAGLVLTTNGGVNFYAGNNPEANGRFHAPPGVRFFTSPVLASASQAALPPAIAARALTVRAVAGTESAADSKQWNARAWAWIGAHPFAAAALLARKAWLVLQAREIPQIESYPFHARRLAAFRPFVVDFGWLWPLAALGLWVAWRRRLAGSGVLLAFAAAMLFPCLAFFVTARYRLACVPEVALLAGLGLSTLVGWIHARAFHRALVAALALLPVALAARLGAQPPHGAAGWESAQMAERLYALGDLAGAIRFQERAAEELPERYEVQLNLALYWSERKQPGDLERAEQRLRDLVRRWPHEAVLVFNLGVVLEEEGRLEEARAAWRAALAADPTFEPARSRLLLSDPPAAPRKPVKK